MCLKQKKNNHTPVFALVCLIAHVPSALLHFVIDIALSHMACYLHRSIEHRMGEPVEYGSRLHQYLWIHNIIIILRGKVESMHDLPFFEGKYKNSNCETCKQL